MHWAPTALCWVFSHVTSFSFSQFPYEKAKRLTQTPFDRWLSWDRLSQLEEVTARFTPDGCIDLGLRALRTAPERAHFLHKHTLQISHNTAHLQGVPWLYSLGFESEKYFSGTRITEKQCLVPLGGLGKSGLTGDARREAEQSREVPFSLRESTCRHSHKHTYTGLHLLFFPSLTSLLTLT